MRNPGPIGGLYTVEELVTLRGLGTNYFTGKTGVEVLQGKYKTKDLVKNQVYLFTMGLGTCSALGIWDPKAGIGSLGHFDGSETTKDIDGMIDGILQKGGTITDLQFAIAGSAQNMTLKSVWECLKDSKLKVGELPKLAASPHDPPVRGPANVFRVAGGSDEVCLVKSISWFGIHP